MSKPVVTPTGRTAEGIRSGKRWVEVVWTERRYPYELPTTTVKWITPDELAKLAEVDG